MFDLTVDTMEYALRVLDSQRKYRDLYNPKSEMSEEQIIAASQAGFYDGMKTMLDLLTSNGYQDRQRLHVDEEGLHFLQVS